MNGSTPGLHVSQLALTESATCFWHRYHESPGNYNVSVRLEGFLDEEALRTSVALLPSRHETLRTSFQLEPGQILKFVHESVQLPLGFFDMSGLTSQNREKEFEYCWENEARLSLDHEKAPLARILLFRLDKWEHKLLFVFHPILTDEFVVQQILDDFASIYAATVSGHPLPPIPAQGVGRASGLPLPMETVANPGDVVHLPRDKDSSTLPLATETVALDLGAPILHRLNDLADRCSVPGERVLFAALVAVMARYSEEQRFSLGWIPSSKASGLGLSSPWDRLFHVAIDLKHQPTFKDWVIDLQQMIATRKGLSKTIDQPPGVVFMWRQAMEPLYLPELKIQRTPHRVVPTALALVGYSEDRHLKVLITYDPNIYERMTILRLGRHLDTLLHAGINYPDQPVHQLPMLTPEERAMLQNLNRADQTSEPPKTLVHQILEECVVKQPSGIALVCGEQRWTFSDLANEAKKLAHHFLEKGVQPKDTVASVLPVSYEFVVSTLALMELGAVLYPLGSKKWTKSLLERLTKLNVGHILHLSSTPISGNLKSFCLDTLLPRLKEKFLPNAPRQIQPQHPVLVRNPVDETLVYSDHQGLMGLIDSQSKISGIGSGEHIVYVSLFESDQWLRDLFAIWRNGGTVLLASAQFENDRTVRSLTEVFSKMDLLGSAFGHPNWAN